MQEMKIFCLLLIFLSATHANKRHVSKNPQDPVPKDNEANLWHVLYGKLNTLLDETNMLRQSISELQTRTHFQENQISKLLENGDKCQCCSSTAAPNDNGEWADDLRYHHENRPYTTQAPAIRHPTTDSEWIANIQPPVEDNGWTVISRRQDGSVDFERNWNDYKHGFGSPEGEFFIGLEKLHQLTSFGSAQELLVTLEDWNNERRYAKYDLFRIGSESEQYALLDLGVYSGGDAGDSLSYHKGMKFSTLDNNKAGHCPKNYGGGWWFNECQDSNLHSVYRQGNSAPNDVTDMRQILWNTWKGWNYSLKFAEMKIRAKQ